MHPADDLVWLASAERMDRLVLRRLYRFLYHNLACMLECEPEEMEGDEREIAGI